MKLKFKVQPYQTHAVDALADCFAGQPKSSGVSYRIDPGAVSPAPTFPQQAALAGMEPAPAGASDAGFKNADVALSPAQLLENLQAVQRRQNLPLSAVLVGDKKTGCPLNLDIEMETGTGKTYCYIKSMFELNKRHGWSKFIVVVPSIAIREGVFKSLQITAEHFLESYGKKARFFIYNSKQLHNLESFSSDAGINVMVINVQAFAARGADNRRIYEELDDFQSRRPIDVIKANRPILILDEPQKMEGAKTLASLSEFNPLLIMRYSATHKTEYNKIHRLDALDAYNQKLVKKIAVRGITVKGLTGTHAYLYLQDIEVSASKPPVARVELEIKQGSGIKRVMRKLGRNDNLYDLSGGLDQYKGYVVAEIDARIDTLSFTNGVELVAGEAVGNVDEAAMRRIQIREAVTVSRRQEVGRGLRLAVNQLGDRMDNPATVHQINELTVVASESYKDFVSALQNDISESLSARPRVADKAYFTGKVLATSVGDLEVTDDMATDIEFYLVQNGYVDKKRNITEKYHAVKKEGSLEQLPDELVAHAEQVFQLIDSVFSEAQLPQIGDGRKAKLNPLNANFEKKEFQALWHKINRKAAYTVHFETAELVGKCVAALDAELHVKPMQYVIERGVQVVDSSFDDLKAGTAFKLTASETENYTDSVHSAVKYDLIGNLAEATQLTRHTIAAILKGINVAVFSQYKTNPEDFIAKAGTLINEQKATAIVEHIAYDPVDESYGSNIFTAEKPRDDFSKAFEAKHHIYNYVFTDSGNERTFAEKLDASAEVVVYAKLPKSFYIPTPVGNYNPDWAIAFQEGKVKHIYFIAETKGSMSTLDLRAIEKSKIACARKFFAKITSDKVKYDVVDSYGKLMGLVK